MRVSFDPTGARLAGEIGLRRAIKIALRRTTLRGYGVRREKENNDDEIRCTDGYRSPVGVRVGVSGASAGQRCRSRARWGGPPHLSENAEPRSQRQRAERRPESDARGGPAGVARERIHAQHRCDQRPDARAAGPRGTVSLCRRSGAATDTGTRRRHRV